VASHQPANGVVALVIGVPSAAVGVVVARRQPGNPLGWLFVAIAACLILSTDGGDYAILAYRLGYHLPFGAVAELLYQRWTPGLLLLGLVVLLFPDGKLPSRFWRRMLWAYLALYAFVVVATAAATAVAIIGHPIHIDSSGGLATTDHPSGWYGTLQAPALILAFMLWLGFAARQALSWRSSSGERRQQLKWLAGGAGVALASAALTLTVSIGWFGFAALPVGIGVGILKYRLYDIDRIISRTLSYALVTGLLVGLYAGLVLLATQVLRFHTPVAVAASTLVAAALFSPARRRVQRLVDRRFNRARYDADRTVAAFAARLSGAIDLDTARAELLGVVRVALEPAHVSLWVKEARE
jgi:hypothetical protein